MTWKQTSPKSAISQCTQSHKPGSSLSQDCEKDPFQGERQDKHSSKISDPEPRERGPAWTQTDRTCHFACTSGHNSALWHQSSPSVYQITVHTPKEALLQFRWNRNRCGGSASTNEETFLPQHVYLAIHHKTLSTQLLTVYSSINS